MLCAVPPNLLIRAAATARSHTPGVLRELHEGWQEFRAHTWLWAIVAQYSVIMMVWYGSFSVLGPAVAAAHLGGPAAWGAIMAAESVGFIVGGVVSLRYSPKRPMLFVAAIGATIAIPPLALAMLWPVWLICLASLGVGIVIEAMMVQWNVAMARYIPAEKLARVAAYDALGTVMSMPLGALFAGPIAAAVGVSATQYGAVVIILATTAVTLVSRDIRTRRYTDALSIPAANSELVAGSALTASAISSEA
jgi:MFS family permease